MRNEFGEYQSDMEEDDPVQGDQGQLHRYREFQGDFREQEEFSGSEDDMPGSQDHKVDPRILMEFDDEPKREVIRVVQLKFGEHPEIVSSTRLILPWQAPQILQALHSFGQRPVDEGSSDDDVQSDDMQSFASWPKQQSPSPPRITASGSVLIEDDYEFQPDDEEEEPEDEYIETDEEAMIYADEVTRELIQDVVDEIYAESLADPSAIAIPPPPESRDRLYQVVRESVLEQMMED